MTQHKDMGDPRTRAKAAINSFIAAPSNRVKNRGKWRPWFQKARAKSQSWKNEGKISIRLHNQGKKTPMSLLLFGDLVTNFFCDI